jgi:hypothetical protein
MGTRGPGNFENDCAADHLYAVCGPLLKQIEDAVKDFTSIAPDEYDGGAARLQDAPRTTAEHLGRPGRRASARSFQRITSLQSVRSTTECPLHSEVRRWRMPMIVAGCEKGG